MGDEWNICHRSCITHAKHVALFPGISSRSIVNSDTLYNGCALHYNNSCGNAMSWVEVSYMSDRYTSAELGDINSTDITGNKNFLGAMMICVTMVLIAMVTYSLIEMAFT